MFRHGFWCFVMVHVLSWFVIFCHGSWCFVMVQYIPDNFKIGVVSLMSQLQLVWWFVMVRDVLWCFVMFRHGSCDGSWCFSVMVSSWFVMVRDVLLSWFHHGLSWFTSWFVMFLCHGFVMVRHGSWCFTVMVSSWFVMVRHGSSLFTSWFVMFLCHGFVMVCHGSSWFVMVHVMVCDVLLSRFRHGSSWFVMFYSLKFSRKGSCDPLFSQSEFQIHYQISFLMRLLFPFPFKEHTSKELC